MFGPAAALVVWMVLDIWRNGRPTGVGAATGIVVGLVAVTPAAGFIGPLSAMAISAMAVSAMAAVPSYFAIEWRSRTRLDDSLDVVAAHGLGGLVGALLTGVFADARWGGSDGLLFGNPGQVGTQLTAVLATFAWSALGTFVLLKFISLVTPLRASSKQERVGMDVLMHGEEAYAEGEGAILVSPDPVMAATATVEQRAQAS